ncbi:MAG: hypothetical protein JXB40_02945 [Candidatus Omnitrophica bacterium]|nr:hypothetical protein [Candidatus Omnitrophota bacterium]
MEKIRPEFIKALIAAAVIFVIGVGFMFSDLYAKVGALEFHMMHATGKCKIDHGINKR